ncbi:hypothetical protein NDU88_004213 [Pleurodeles waltl]|uniref:Uncharacterized protein n=1 Tax=Pleurodeles waltl TaxID=8319 RepID=A0AAV7M9A9_PLEWA|nr:hypothetical protein NDU88_004213 [Pleurodeles waltl]
MCRLTGTQPIPSGAAGVVLWQSAALELRRMRLAVARFPKQFADSADDSTRLMGLQEGAQPFVSKWMEVVPIEVSVETAGDNSGGEKDQCSAAVVDLNLQEDQTGEPSPVLMGNDNVVLGFLQMLRMEAVCLSPTEEMIVKLKGEIKRCFSVSEASQAGIKEIEALENTFDLLAKRTQLLENLWKLYEKM